MYYVSYHKANMGEPSRGTLSWGLNMPLEFSSEMFDNIHVGLTCRVGKLQTVDGWLKCFTKSTKMVKIVKKNIIFSDVNYIFSFL